jgi:hypothetical protein
MIVEFADAAAVQINYNWQAYSGVGLREAKFLDDGSTSSIGRIFLRQRLGWRISRVVPRDRLSSIIVTCVYGQQ